MSLLSRVIFRNNALILLPALVVGTGIYVITDLFERLDNFIDAQLGLTVIASYFLYKLPLIVSQILPVVFLLATVIQLCLMARNRETTALYAGGVSPLTMLGMLFACGLIWGAVQLGFSQWVGVSGEQQASLIWQEQVRNRTVTNKVLTNIWFTEKGWIVSLGTVNPDNTGTDLLAYRLSPDSLRLEEMIESETFFARPGGWELQTVQRTDPSRFAQESLDSLILPLGQDMHSFRLLGTSPNPQQWSVFELGSAIDSLQASGSNVEMLRTAWHAKLAYAASLAVMTLVGMAIATWKDNVYLASGVALVSTLVYYAIYTLATALGQRGVLPPLAAAWLANVLAVVLASLKLAPLLVPHRR